MPADRSRAWSLPLRSALAAALAFSALAMLCEALFPALPAHTPIRSADTGAMMLLAPLVWAIELIGLLVVALPAAALGAVFGRLAMAGWRMPVLAVLALPGGLLLGAVYAQLAGAASALAAPPMALACGLAAAAAAVVAIGVPPSPARIRR